MLWLKNVSPVSLEHSQSQYKHYMHELVYVPNKLYKIWTRLKEQQYLKCCIHAQYFFTALIFL